MSVSAIDTRREQKRAEDGPLLTELFLKGGAATR